MLRLIALLLPLALLASCGPATQPPGPPLDHDLSLRLELRTEADGGVLDRSEVEVVLPSGTPLADRIELEAPGVTLHVLGLFVEGDRLYFRGWGYRGDVGMEGPVGNAFATETTGHESERTHSATLDGAGATGEVARVDPDEGPSTVVRYVLSFARS